MAQNIPVSTCLFVKTSGGQRTSDSDYPPSKVLIPERLEGAVIQSLRGVFDEIHEGLGRGRIALYDLPHRKFEEFIASLFANHGYKVELTKATRDNGYDIIAISENPLDQDLRIIIECKRWAPDRPVGIGVVRQLWGVIADPERKFDRGIVATSSYLSRQAESEIKRKFWRLDGMDHDKIMHHAGFRKESNGLWVPNG